RFEPATVARGAGSSRCRLPRGDAKRQRFIRRDHFRGIRSGLWPELFSAPAEGLGRIQIALRVDRKLVNAPESARELTEGAPRVEEMAGLVELEELIQRPIRDPDVTLIGRNVNVPGIADVRPLVEEFP